MILAEKLSQKLNNLKSKKEIQDFFIFFDEFRNLDIINHDGSISTKENPTHYVENSEGYYLIVWDNEYLSTGQVNTTSVNDFDDFITHAQKTKRLYDSKVFVPERGIYPMVITYSKSLADMIDIPEYLLKLSDLTHELDKMIHAEHGSSYIKVRDGVRYAYSSRFLDEYYSYSRFSLDKSIGDLISWHIESSDVFPIVKFQEVFSFIGDLYNLLQTSATKELPSGKADIILSPALFQKLFKEQILDNIKGQHLLNGTSCFKPEHFEEKLKCLNTLSVSYDPLLNQKIGTYRFTDFGLKPKKQYFIKYGKLDTPITDNINYSKLGYDLPTMDITGFANIKIEGLKKKSFNESRKSNVPVFFCINDATSSKIDFTHSSFYFSHSLLYDKNKTYKVNDLSFQLNLIDLIRNNQVELVEFVDGQIGCKVVNFDIA
jgi:hypothetical protein